MTLLDDNIHVLVALLGLYAAYFVFTAWVYPGVLSLVGRQMFPYTRIVTNVHDERVWEAVIVLWDAPRMEEQQALLMRAVRRGEGTPPFVRHQLWPLWTSVQTQHGHWRSGYTKGLYSRLQMMAVDDEPISRDVYRTFPEDPRFSPGGVGPQILLRVLRAFAALRREVGYCQGMNFIAGVILINVGGDVLLNPKSRSGADSAAREEKCFYTFVAVMTRLRCLFLDGLPAVQECLEVFDRLFQRELPDLRAHFEARGISVHMFAMRWFSTVWCAEAPPLRDRVLEAVIASGSLEVSFRVALAVLHTQKGHLMTATFNDAMFALRNMRRTGESDAEMHNVDALLQRGNGISIDPSLSKAIESIRLR